MRSRPLRILLWAVLALAALPLAALAFLATGPGARVLADAVARLSSGQAKLHGLSIDLPGGISAARVELADPKGIWMTIEGVDIAWSPAALLHRELLVESLQATRIAVARLPAAEGGGSNSGGGTLPGRAILRRLHVDRIELAPPVAGVAAALSLDGAATIDALDAGEIRLDLARLGAPGQYRLAAKAAAGTVQAELALQEPEGGLVGGLAGLPALGALDVRATAEGSLADLALKATLGAGPLRAGLAGTLDMPGKSARLDATLTAPAMAPRPDLSFRAATLEAHVEGPFAAPRGTARLKLDGLAAAGIAVAGITADAQAGDGRLHATAEIAGIAGPGLEPLGAAPVRITLDGPFAGPLAVTLRHPLVEITGTGAEDGTGEVRLALPDLARLRSITGLALAGAAETTAKLRWKDNALAVDATGALAVTAAPEPAVALLGPRATFTAAGTLRGADVTGGRFTLDGKALRVALQGDWKAAAADAAWQVELNDLTVLVPTLAGTARLDGRTTGPADDLALQAKLAGDIAVAGAPATPVTAEAKLRGLPLHPAGTLAVGGTLDGAPVSLDAALARDPDGTLRFDMARAGWKSGTGSAHLVLRPGAALPEGEAALAVPKLDEAGQLLGLPLAGGAELTARFAADKASLALSLTRAGLPGTATAESARLEATMQDPMGARDLALKLSVAGLAAGGMTTGLTLDAAGPPDRIALKLDGTTGLPGDPVRLSAAAQLDALARRLDLQQLRALWRGETVALAAPARIDFAEGVAVDRLRLGLRGAALEVAGRLAPALDLTASLRDLPVDLARLALPEAKAEGRIQATARLTGPPAAPAGTIRLSATGLRWRDGVGAALKPGSLTANATLAGARATLDVKAESGDTSLTLSGTAPLGQGALNLRLTGRSGLAAIDAVLAAGGRRLRGTLALDATLGGTTAAPRAGGRLTLAGGDLQDRALGVRIRDLAAEITGDGETIRLARLAGRAGPGTIAAEGTLGLGATLPVSLSVTLRQARLLASPLVTGTLDGTLAVTGGLADRLAASGTVTLGRTDINVPDSLPASVPVLNVRRPGDKPPPPPTPPLPVALDVTVKAPGEIFIRGRGIDAELQGELHVGGEAAALRPTGGFTLRRGTLTLAGQVLTFTSGTVTLDGGLPIDPLLDFKASTSTTGTAGTIIATVAVGGHASKPVITLTSVPELPADEVLAQLLFNRGTSTLGPLELAQLAGALAELSGVGPKISPLESLRAKLGLDRLSVGAGSNGAAASIQAGRTIAPGVYLGAKQNAGGGGGTQATVEVDLYKGLKLHADVGTGGSPSATGAAGSSGGSGVGLTYQFEY